MAFDKSTADITPEVGAAPYVHWKKF